MKPVTIIAAPNGARKTKADLPQIPITPEELAIEAVRCADAGVSLFHMHVRREDQVHSLDPQRYRPAIAAVKAAVGDKMLIQVTTETVGMYGPQDMIATVKALVPESASIGVRELIPDRAAEPAAKEFLHWATQAGILLQYICYSGDDVRYFADLRDRTVIPARKKYFLLYVLGKKTGEKGHPSELTAFLQAAQEWLSDCEIHWTVCAFGEDELDCMLEAVRRGGNVRIGFENNHLMADGTVAPDNAALIHQFTAAIRKLDAQKQVADAEYWRSIAG